MIKRIRDDQTIKGIRTPRREVKLTAYADDLTALLIDMNDLNNVEKTLNEFGEISGLKLNQDKTEVLAIGQTNLTAEQEEKLKDVIKVTGICHGLPTKKIETKDANFTGPINKLQRTLNLWKSRNLSLLGRAQIFKAQGLAAFMHIANVIPIPSDVTSRINKIMYNFIWRGPDKMSREFMAKPIEEGGLNIAKPEDAFDAATLTWVKRSQVSQHPWTDYFFKDCDRIGGLRNLQRNNLSIRDNDMLTFNKFLFKSIQKNRQNNYWHTRTKP